MKIKANVLLAGPWGVAQPGEWLDVPEQIAKVLVEGGFADLTPGLFPESADEYIGEGEIETTDMPPGETALGKAALSKAGGFHPPRPRPPGPPGPKGRKR